ncbi:hypothetical protein GPALN_010798 [Globodera pallida]|nr:hypothetical protein GPALN_010798 [Globodera pallida]
MLLPFCHCYCFLFCFLSINALIIFSALALNCEGRADGTLGAVKSGKCYNKFGKCAYGKMFTFECPDELFYNEETEKCDYKAEIVACGGKPSVPRFDCSEVENGLYTVEHCFSSVFYSCNAGHATQMRCSAGLLFDQTKKLCEFPDRCKKIVKISYPPPLPSSTASIG